MFTLILGINMDVYIKGNMIFLKFKDDHTSEVGFSFDLDKVKLSRFQDNWYIVDRASNDPLCSFKCDTVIFKNISNLFIV